MEKFNYIHLNPVKASLVTQPEDWYGSSAAYYKQRFGTCLIGREGASTLDFTALVEDMAEGNCLSLIREEAVAR